MRNTMGRGTPSVHPEAERAPHEGVSALASGGPGKIPTHPGPSFTNSCMHPGGRKNEQCPDT
jgi:hypothetical protein